MQDYAWECKYEIMQICNMQICNYERLCMRIQIGHYAIIQICQPLHETSQNFIPTLLMHWYRTGKTAVQQNAKKTKGGGDYGPGRWTVDHTSYLSRNPWEFSCKFFLAGVNFYRSNAKNWQFTLYFAVITQNSVYSVVIYAFFWCKFYSPKILLV